MNTKTLSLLTIGLLSSTASFAGQAACPEFNIAGKWKNGWGVGYKIEQPSCKEVTITYLKNSQKHHIELDGKTALTIDGTQVSNGPRLITFSTEAGGWDKKKILPLIEEVQAVGKIIPNPYYNPAYGHSKYMAEFTLTAKIAVPRDASGKKFYPIQASVKATALLTRIGTKNEDLFISLDDPKVISVGGGEAPAFASGFMKGINALLSLQSYWTSPDKKDAAFVDGPRIFRNLIDSNSRTLKRVP